MRTVLITSTGSVATDITIKSLKRMGFRLVGCNIYPKEWVVESCEMDIFYQAPPVIENEKYLNFIKCVCQKENIKYIFPMIDYEIDLFNKNRSWFEKNEIVLCMSPKKALDIIRDKKELADFVRENCPDTLSIPTLRVNEIKKLEWDFPIVCKPYNGRSSQGLKYIYTEQEWQEFLKRANRDIYIVEPFIKGPVVMVEVVRQKKPHKVIAMTRRELLSTPNGCATAVYVFQNRELEEATKILADKLDILGDVNFEYILDKDGKYHLVECNPRFSAGCEFSCLGGYDYVENHMKCFMGQEIEDAHFKHNMVIARKYEEYITAVDIDVPYQETYH
ncbi:ATP-grasp domain-containing protein [Bacillota bacterium LCP21S3_A4]